MMKKEADQQKPVSTILERLAEGSRNGLVELAMGLGFTAGPILRSSYLLTGVAYPCGESLDMIEPFKVMDAARDNTRAGTDMIMEQQEQHGHGR